MIHLIRPFDQMALGTVTRWHTLRTARQQTVSEHTQRVTMIAVTLGRSMAPHHFDDQTELEVRRLVEWHDLHESVFGDMPHPVKRWLLDSEALDFDLAADAAFCEQRGVTSPFAHASHLAKALVRVADRLEGACFYWQEGLSMWDPELGHVPTAIVRTAMKVLLRELPEVAEVACTDLVEATVPADLVVGMREELAA